MKKLLTILLLSALTTSTVLALDGDTYRAERERVEKMYSSGYVQQPTVTTGAQTTGKTKRRWFGRNKYEGPDMNSYYNFGTFNEYKGYNGQ